MSNRFEIGVGAPSGLYPWAIEGTVNAGDVVAISTTAPRTVVRAAAGTANSQPPIGIATAVSGGAAQVAVNGEIATGLAGLTRGTAYWLSTTAGQITSTEPLSNKFVVGVAVSATELLVDASQADLTPGGSTGTVTSFGVSSSDFTVSNSPITTSGDVSLALNTVPISKGGTGQTTKTNAFDALAPTTTKGDLIVFNGTDNVRVPVGTNGQYVKADSTQAAGLAWAGTGTFGSVSSVAVTTSNGITGSGTVSTSGNVSLTLGNLSLARGGTGLTSLTAAGNALYASSTSAITPQATNFSYKNKLINGAMAVDQRNGGTVVQCNAATTTYTVDRWYVGPTGNAVTAQQISVGSNAPGFQYGLQIVGAASVTAVTLAQRIESTNSAEFSVQSTRISFWANNNTGASKSISLSCYCPNTIDNWVGGFTQSGTTQNVTLATGWAQYAVSITQSASALNGLSVEFTLGALTAGQDITITGVQIERNTVATTFEARPLAMEQALCYRYYQRFQANSLNTSVSFGAGTCTSTTNAYVFVKYKQRMRTSPTVTSSVANNDLALIETATRAATGVATTNVGTDAATLTITSASLTAGRAVSFGANASASAYVAFSAEL